MHHETQFPLALHVILMSLNAQFDSFGLVLVHQKTAKLAAFGKESESRNGCQHCLFSVLCVNSELFVNTVAITKCTRP